MWSFSPRGPSPISKTTPSEALTFGASQNSTVQSNAPRLSRVVVALANPGERRCFSPLVNKAAKAAVCQVIGGTVRPEGVGRGVNPNSGLCDRPEMTSGSGAAGSSARPNRPSAMRAPRPRIRTRPLPDASLSALLGYACEGSSNSQSATVPARAAGRMRRQTNKNQPQNKETPRGGFRSRVAWRSPRNGVADAPAACSGPELVRQRRRSPAVLALWGYFRTWVDWRSPRRRGDAEKGFRRDGWKWGIAVAPAACPHPGLVQQRRRSAGVLALWGYFRSWVAWRSPRRPGGAETGFRREKRHA